MSFTQFSFARNCPENSKLQLRRVSFLLPVLDPITAPLSDGKGCLRSCGDVELNPGPRRFEDNRVSSI